MLRNNRDEFLGSVESDLNTNLKRFWSILKLNSKSQRIRDRVSTPISASAFADRGNRTPLRSSAENPREIANLFNFYIASVFGHDTPSPLPRSSRSPANAPASPNITVSEVHSVLEALDVTKAARKQLL